MNPRVRQAYREFDVEAKRLLKGFARREGVTIPCRRGCSACCYDIAWTIRAEVDELAERIRSWPTSQRERVLEGLRAWAAGMRAAGLDPDHKFPDVRAYHRARLRCPLLGDDGACTVYDIRPLSCRAHYVIGGAAQCANRAEEPVVDTAEMPGLVTQALLTILGPGGGWGGGGMPKEALLQRYLGEVLGVDMGEAPRTEAAQ
jgi:Fe-S-cluster containining protein